MAAWRRAAYDRAMTKISNPALAPPKPERVGTQTDLLGECPLWDERLQCLWWVDIRAPALRRWDPARRALSTWPMPELVGSIALTERDGVVLVALRSRLALFDAASESFETVVEAQLPADHRFNDGRCDRQGRFWVGTMQHVTRAAEGSLFRLDAHGFEEVIAGGIAIPNSLAFSPDGRTMYFADSLQHRIDTFDYDIASGTRGAGRSFAAIEPPAFPDGCCVDAEGFLWSAQFHNARLVRYASDGRVDRTLAVPMKRPTCCTFGGADFGTLYVTGVSHSMSDAERTADPLAGALFAFDIGREWGIRGLPEPRLNLP
jgi:sugar lactone lactonase YvrE